MLHEVLVGVRYQIDPASTLQVGVSEAGQVLCHGSAPLVRLTTLFFGLALVVYVLKFLLRAMIGLDKAGEVPAGRSARVNRMKKNRYKILQTRDALYSLLAGISMTVALMAIFPVMGISIIECLA